MQGTIQFLGGFLTLLGALGIVTGLVMLRFPGAVRAGLLAFPRSRWPGRILTAVCVCWIAWVISHAALGRFEGLKPLVPVAALLLFAAVVMFLDELLSPRALGGLLLLLANPVLNGVRWVDSPWRIAAVLIAYAWVLIGCAWVLHPWLFRKMADPVTRSESRFRTVAWLKALGGAVLLAAGLWQFR